MKLKSIIHFVAYIIILLPVTLVFSCCHNSKGPGYEVKVTKHGLWSSFHFPPLSKNPALHALNAAADMYVSDRTSSSGPDYIMGIVPDRNALWVGSFGGGLWHMDMERGKWLNMTGYLKKPGEVVRPLYSDDKSMWCETRESQGVTVETYLKREDVWRSNFLNGISYAQDNSRIIVETKGFLSLYDMKSGMFPQPLKRLKNEFPVVGPSLLTGRKYWAPVAERSSRKGETYLGTAGILCGDFDKESTRVYKIDSGIDRREFLRCNALTISCLVPDGADIWAGTAQGIFKYSACSDTWALVYRHHENLSQEYFIMNLAVTADRVYFIPNAIGTWHLFGAQKALDYILVYDKVHKHAEKIPLPRPLALCCAAQGEGNLWFGALDGSLWTYNEEKGRWNEELKSQGKESRFSPGIIVLTKTHVIVGSNDGLLIKSL